MNSDRLSEMMLEVFGRFMISGILFYLFLIWLPVFLFFRPQYDTLITSTTIIVLCSLVIGLLLDISRFYRLSWKLPNLKDIRKEYLEIGIVKAFQIKVEGEKTTDGSYKGKVNQLANQIHEVFIRTKCPEAYQHIRGARLYPDVLSMTLLSILLFTVEWIVIIILAFAGLIQISLNPNEKALFGFIALCALGIFWRGLDRVRLVYGYIMDFTIQLIKEGYCRSNPDDRDAFLLELEERGLIVRETENSWKVSEGS
jgi:hypothetical protein